MSTFSIVYVSTVSDSVADNPVPEIEAILATARGCNAETGVHGALFVTEGRFVQVLEGEQTAVQATFDRISLDPRHHAIEVLCTQKTSKPRFADWSMAFVGDTPALRERFTDASLAEIGSQLNGDALLDFMLKIARSPD